MRHEVLADLAAAEFRELVEEYEELLARATPDPVFSEPENVVDADSSPIALVTVHVGIDAHRDRDTGTIYSWVSLPRSVSSHPSGRVIFELFAEEHKLLYSNKRTAASYFQFAFPCPHNFEDGHVLRFRNLPFELVLVLNNDSI